MVNDGKRERELLLVERLVVGRDPACDITVEDGLLSRRHAEFVAAAEAVTVRDLGSRNGVFVNGTRRAEQALRPGDVVQIGPLRVRYLADRAAAGVTRERLNADGTIMIPVGPEKTPAIVRPAAAPPEMDLDEELEGETGLIAGAAFASLAKTPPRGIDAAADADGMTSFTPTPRPAPFAAAVAAAKIQDAPPPAPVQRSVAPASSVEERALASYVLVQMGSLAVIVFVSTIMPVIVARGAVLRAVDEGSFQALLLWPFLPLAIALAATVVVANLVNRRILDVMKSHRNGEGR